MISYNPLLKMLIDKKMRKTDLKKMAGIGTTTLAKLSRDEYVALEVIDKLCQVLKCQPGEILEYKEKPAE